MQIKYNLKTSNVNQKNKNPEEKRNLKFDANPTIF